MKVAIVGAGIAGLTIAWRLASDRDVVVFEREPLAGGKIRSQSIDGFRFEWGPAGFLSSATELRAMIDELGLSGDLREAGRSAAKRYVFWHGRLRAVPATPPQALGTTLLSPLGKLRAIAELALPPAAGAPPESVAAFMTRHFGREVAERLVAPAVLGISGGEAAQTSLDALFPRLRALEQEHRSLLRGLIRARRTPGRLTGFGAHGMQRLTDRLAERLGPRLRTDCGVRSATYDGQRWQLRHDAGTTEADALVVATPAPAAADILAGCDAELAALLRRIRYAPMRVAGIAYRHEDVPRALDGFGFLAARNQGLRSLGCLYTSAIAPEQAPVGVAYLRLFLGGSVDPAAARLSSAEAEAVIKADLAVALGIRADPVACHEIVWNEAIPQYDLDHPQLLDRLRERVQRRPGLALAGNAYRGLGVADTVREALAVAATIA